MEENTSIADLLRQKAPTCKTLGALSVAVGIGRATMYRMFDKDPAMKDLIEELLGTNVETSIARQITKAVKRETKNKKVSQNRIVSKTSKKTKAEPVTITFNPKEGRLPKTDIADRIRLARQICELIRKGSTVGQACGIVGVGHTTFYDWGNPSHETYVEEIRIMKAEAINAFNTMYDEEVTLLARSSLNKIVSGHEITQTVKIGKVDKKGNVVAHTVRQETKKVLPNFAATRFALEKTQSHKFGTPEERRFSELSDNKVDYTHRAKTLDELNAEEQALKDKLGIKD